MLRKLTQISALAILTAFAAAADAQNAYDLDIPAQSLAEALRAVGQRTATNILFEPALVKGIRVPALRALLSADAAIRQLLNGTELRGERTSDDTIVVRNAKEVKQEYTSAAQARNIQLAQLQASQQATPDASARPENSQSERQTPGTSANPSADSGPKGIPEILVKGSRSINSDIQRTESDAQPYVIFDREEIQRSQATDIESFLMQRLPMNTARSTLNQMGAERADWNFGTINLRGLGTSQTLILIDGRRLPPSVSAAEGGDLLQPNFNGIPLSSVERIEVLPATASGIYGGGATGGVINIIRKRDYRGLDLQATYGGTFRSDTESVDLNISGGWAFNEGRTNINVSLSHAEQSPLNANDRNFVARSRALALANNPAVVTYGGFLPPLAARPNICAAGEVFSTPQGPLAYCSGQPLSLDNGTSLGSSITSVPAGYTGPGSDNGAGLAANAGAYDLSATDTGIFLIRSPVNEAGSFSLRQTFSDSVSAFLDGSVNRSDADLSTRIPYGIYTALEADDPANPFEQNILSFWAAPALQQNARSDTQTVQAVGGLIVRLPKSWSASLERNWSRTRARYEAMSGLIISDAGYLFATPYGLRDPAADPVDLSPYLLPTPDTFGGPFDSLAITDSLRLSGSVLSMPAGRVQLAGLMERREEKAQEAFVDYTAGLYGSGTPIVQYVPPRKREQQSYYFEAQIPLASAAQRLPLMRSLDVRASVRRDEYQTRTTSDMPVAPTRDGPFAEPVYFKNDGGSTSYTLAAKYEPFDGLALRASVGTGYLPPNLSQLQNYSSEWTFSLPIPALNPPDPLRGNTPLSTPRTQVGGGNPDLLAEDSRSLSLGFIIAPTAISGLRVSVDYVGIKKTNEAFLPSLGDIVSLESQLPGRVVRGGNLPSDPAGWAGPVTFIDGSLANLARTLSRSVDLQADYGWTTAFGDFHIGGIATRMLNLERQLNARLEAYDLVGYFDGVLKWRAQGGVSWERNAWSVAWSTQFYGSYSIENGLPSLADLNPDRVLTQGSRKVPGQIYHDVLVRYTSPGSAGVFANTQLGIGIQNVFDTYPPTIAQLFQGSTDDGYSTYGDPRLRRFTVTVRKSFQ